MFWYGSLTLAQTEPPPQSPTAPAPAAPSATGTATQQPAAPGTTGTNTGQDIGGGLGPVWMITLFIAMMWLLIFLPQRKEKKKHAQLMASLKKGDRVQTIGGILGVIVDVREQDVIVKVDESNNTRIKFTRAAIQGVVGEEKV